MLDEDANLGGHPAAGRPHGKDWDRSLKRSEKAENGTFSEFCGEKPCWSLGDPQMFKNTHPHLFDIAGSKDSFGDDALRVWSGAKIPRLRRSLARQRRPIESDGDLPAIPVRRVV